MDAGPESLEILLGKTFGTSSKNRFVGVTSELLPYMSDIFTLSSLIVVVSSTVTTPFMTTTRP